VGAKKIDEIEDDAERLYDRDLNRIKRTTQKGAQQSVKIFWQWPSCVSTSNRFLFYRY